MAKLTITNLAEPHWDSVIEDRVQLMLGSIQANLRRIDVEFASRVLYMENPVERPVESPVESPTEQPSETPVQRSAAKRQTHICTIKLTESSGIQHQLRNEQADANAAVEGALARARRAVTRRKRTRLTRQGPVSA